MSLAHSNFQSKTIKNHQKPREKAAKFGIGNLSIAELLALILGSGTKKQSVFVLSKKLAATIEAGRFADIDVKHFAIGKIQLLKLQAAL